MGRESIPQSVLYDAIRETIAGRKVRVAVFTTYSFDPGFFELHVLPVLFDISFNQNEKIRRLQLDDAVRTLGEIAVYYDRTALAQDAQPAQLDFRRIDVRRRTGVFHPKLVLLLVENSTDDADSEEQASAPLSLIVGVLSANLTRAGWWENVEAGHIEEIKSADLDNGRCPFRVDLLGLMQQLQRSAGPDEQHLALDRIHDFVVRDVNRGRLTKNITKGKFLTRIFYGQDSLPGWVRDVRLSAYKWNLEILSPYFDADDVSTLKALQDVLTPDETRIYLPTDESGKATVTRQYYDDATQLGTWSRLPAEIVRAGGRQHNENRLPRFVHAKVYRLWKAGCSVMLVGSVNLTRPAHSRYGAGNLEAAFLTETTDDLGGRAWWLEPLDHPPRQYADKMGDETAEGETVGADISFSYDWKDHALRYRLVDPVASSIEVSDTTGKNLFTIVDPRAGSWIDCGPEPAQMVGNLLPSSSFLLLKCRKDTWRVLIREEEMAQKPSILTTLTPEEILMCWSFLTDEQREWLIETKLGAQCQIEGLNLGAVRPEIRQTTIFDRFAGLYHSFEQLKKHVDHAVLQGLCREAEARLFGEKYDSLPALLQKVLSRGDGDLVMNYLTFLSADQLAKEVAATHRDFWTAHRDEADKLSNLIGNLPALRAAIALGPEAEKDAFLNWYERMFLRRTIPLPEET
jgi:hypothetical protein